MKHSIIGIALLAACGSANAGDSPVDQARADCAAHKMKVHALESRMAKSAELSGARKAWERSCAHAQALMASGSDRADHVAAREVLMPAHEPPSVTIYTPAQCVTAPEQSPVPAPEAPTPAAPAQEAAPAS